ncbi:MAG: gliding motility-associated C-terminal domain-containing protein [Prolixibacteraceae bacterium]|nr:gliding motility-associated C-terminal domain-containing protein [Prolixibacteraceae bacterium]
MQRRTLYTFLLFFILVWPASLLKGQTRHVVVLNSTKDYRVTKQPGTLSTVWAVFTDPKYTVPATSEQAEIISMGEGRENEIKVKWLSEGVYYLMVTMTAENGCSNRKAWPFSVEPPGKLTATAFCQDGVPWIKWEATAEGFALNNLDITIKDLQGKTIETIDNAPVSGTIKWPSGGNKSINAIPASLAAIDIDVVFNDIPGSKEQIVRLDAPDCKEDAVVAVNDTIPVWYGIENIIEIAYNDYDTKGTIDSLSINILTPVSNGDIHFDSKTGEITYFPDKCFFGTDSFRYTISNIEGVISNEAVVYLKVNINPTVDSDNDSILDINEDIVGTGNLCDTDTDMDGKPNFLDDDDDNDGIATIDEPGDLNGNGIPDYLEDWNSIAVTDHATTSIEIPVMISVMANDSSSMLPATLSIVVNPQNGYVNVDSYNGEVNYNPDFDFMGQDSFIYVVCDAYNICDTALVVVNVEDLVIAPEVFTPNDDGYNDRYIISGLERYPENGFIVYNRWGNKVYERNNYANDWDGKSNSKYKLGGQPLPVGVYYYILKYAKNRVKSGGLYLER